MAINVMIVDDSIFIRVLLKEILESTTEEEIKVVASVSSGIEAIREIRLNKQIDVVTLDIRMPGMDGLETLKEIMAIKKLPVLMISSLTQKGSAKTLDALELGAIDFITKDKDEFSNSLYGLKEEIRSKVIAVSKSNIRERKTIERQKIEGIYKNSHHIVAIGSSTGGPTALKILLTSIPKGFTSPIVIAQHMPEGAFIDALADKLNQSSNYCVKVIENGEEVKQGVAYLCPGGQNVEIFKRGNKFYLVLTKKLTNENVYRPSVNMLFSSLSRLERSLKKTAIVLTGMGDDGAKGAIAVHEAGGTVICESKKTAVVYGMPRKVAELNIPKYVADIEKIFKYLDR